MKTLTGWKGVRVGQEVWVRARISHVPGKGTLGYAHGMLTCTAITHGLNQEEKICTDLRNVARSK